MFVNRATLKIVPCLQSVGKAAFPSTTPTGGLNSLKAARFASTARGRWSAEETEGDSFSAVASEDDNRILRRNYGLLRVPEGTRMAVWSRRGEMRLVDGPNRLLTYGSDVLELKRYVASSSEFIRIIKKNGEKEYVYGPAAVWEHPLEHYSIKVLSSITVNQNEALVVYREKEGNVTRRVVRGPSLHLPCDTEWIHRFVWHGHDPLAPEGINRKKVGQLVFTKLRMMPDQLYFDVEKVRTKDDALLVVKAMIFMQLEDIEKMLDATHDPVSDFINSVSADVVEATSNLTFDEFRARSNMFNDLNTYTMLVAKAKEIGYNISKIVFRGYDVSDTLQGMHDGAIEARTQLRVDRETEEQAQALLDFKQEKDNLRSAKSREETRLSTEHDLAMERLQSEHNNETERMAHELQLSIEKARREQELELEQRSAEWHEQHLQKLREMGVDLTAYLVASKQGAPAKLVKIEGGAGQAQMHFHEGGDGN